MKTVNKLDYTYRKLVVSALEKHNNTVDITDEDYDKYYLSEYKPEPLPDSDIPIPGEENPDHDYSQDYLTFEALEDGTFSFSDNSLYYSINNGVSWNSLAAGTETELITAGTKVLWKRDLYIYINSSSNLSIGRFSSTNKFNISGNILSLFYINNFYEYNILPQKSSYSSSYYSLNSMFEGCSKLINAKNLILPLTLTQSCFFGLFYNCTSLMEVPELPATKLVVSCYQKMFYGCTSLNYIKMLASNISASGCLDNWLEGVSPTGIFIKNSKMTFNIGSSGIPAGWEVIDEEVPEE